jgi:lipopolysaccharide export system protein LptA
MTRRLAALRPALPLFAALALARAAEPAAPKPAVAPPVETVIDSGSAEMISTDKETTFILRDRVTVTGTNLKITADEIVVVMRRRGDAAATLGNPQSFKSLVATGKVRIVQGDREALCERAEIFPADDRVLLTGTPHPRVRTLDGQYEATAPRMELVRGERIARLLSEDGTRVQFTLPALKDLGFDPNAPKEPPRDGTPTVPAPATPAPAPVITVPIPPPKK